MKLIFVISFIGYGMLYGQSRLPKFLPDESTVGLMDFSAILEQYIRQNIGILDSVIEDNGQEDDGYQSTLTYHLNGGHTYIETTQWESWSLSIEFNQVRKKDVTVLVLKMLRQADKLSPEIESLLRSNASVTVPVEDGCCFFSLTAIDEKVILDLELSE